MSKRQKNSPGTSRIRPTELRYASAVQVTTFGCFTGTAACLPFAGSCCPSSVRHTIRAGTI